MHCFRGGSGSAYTVGVQKIRDWVLRCDKVGRVNCKPALGTNRTPGVQNKVLVLPATRSWGGFSWLSNRKQEVVIHPGNLEKCHIGYL